MFFNMGFAVFFDILKQLPLQGQIDHQHLEPGDFFLNLAKLAQFDNPFTFMKKSRFFPIFVC